MSRGYCQAFSLVRELWSFQSLLSEVWTNTNTRMSLVDKAKSIVTTIQKYLNDSDSWKQVKQTVSILHFIHKHLIK